MRISLSLCLLIFLLPAGRVEAAGSVVGLGDSLIDTGNFSISTLGAIPPAPLYYNGRFSNGPVWIEVLANQLGLAGPTPSLSGGTNYAFNGARLAGASPYMTPDITTQAGWYLASVGGMASPDDLFVISGGANDLFFSLARGP